MAISVKTWSIVDEFNALMKRKALNENKEEIRKATSLFGELIEKVISSNKEIETIKSKKKSISATIKFTKREIEQMDVEFRKEIKATGGIARLIKMINNGRAMYEIRYHRNGYNLSVCSSSLIEAKQKFIQEIKLKNIKKGA